tara:strand:- start:1120 stop:1260 length:141 start_codon:yes stop_codon:yes gene_type:complete
MGVEDPVGIFIIDPNLVNATRELQNIKPRLTIKIIKNLYCLFFIFL